MAQYDVELRRAADDPNGPPLRTRRITVSDAYEEVGDPGARVKETDLDRAVAKFERDERYDTTRFVLQIKPVLSE